jgi:hypothetical protein
LEELAAMAGRIWCGATEQFPADGSFLIPELELSAASMPRIAESDIAHSRLWPCCIALPGVIANWMVVGGWFCCWIDLQENNMGQHVTLLRALFVLFIEISQRFHTEDLFASIFGARNLGPLWRTPDFANAVGDSYVARDLTYISYGFFFGRFFARLEFSALESQLDAHFSSVVSGTDIP